MINNKKKGRVMKLFGDRQKKESFVQKITESKKKYLDSRKESDLEKKTKLFFKKIFLVLKKNYYVATRNPKLYLSLIFAPLLFVLIIGMAFNTSQLRSELRISIYDESPNQTIFKIFEEIESVLAVPSSSSEECKQTTIDKENVVCIVILENEKDAFDVDIYFDYSRMSVYPTAYATVREVFGAFEQEMMMNVLFDIRNQVDPARFGFEVIQKDLKQTETELMNASEKINTLASSLSSNSTFYEYKLDEVILEIKSLKTQIIDHQSRISNYRTEIRTQKQQAEKSYEQINKMGENVKDLVEICGSLGQDKSSQIQNEDFLELLQNDPEAGCTSVKTINGLMYGYELSFKNLKEGLERADRDLDDVYESLDALKLSTDLYVVELENEKQQISETEDFYSSEIIDFQESLLQHSQKVSEYSQVVKDLNLNVSDFHSSLNPREIVNKFDKKFLLLSDTRNMLDYTLHLVIPFILLLSSLLLSITLNRNEHKTSAFQRNKMLNNNFLIFSGNTLFILLIMILELLFILTLFNIFFGSNTLFNLPYVLLLSTIFILIWTVIGFIISRNINSDEGAIFSGTVLGLIVFFLSDVIVPVESFPDIMLYLYKMNPFVYFSEIIRSTYLIRDPLSVISSTSLILLFTLILFLGISVFLIWRDMRETAT